MISYHEKMDFCKKQGHASLWCSRQELDERLKALLNIMDCGKEELEHEAVKALLRLTVYAHIGP